MVLSRCLGFSIAVPLLSTKNFSMPTSKPMALLVGETLSFSSPFYAWTCNIAYHLPLAYFFTHIPFTFPSISRCIFALTLPILEREIRLFLGSIEKPLWLKFKDLYLPFFLYLSLPIFLPFFFSLNNAFTLLHNITGNESSVIP